MVYLCANCHIVTTKRFRNIRSGYKTSMLNQAHECAREQSTPTPVSGMHVQGLYTTNKGTSPLVLQYTSQVTGVTPAASESSKQRAELKAVYKRYVLVEEEADCGQGQAHHKRDDVMRLESISGAISAICNKKSNYSRDTITHSRVVKNTRCSESSNQFCKIHQERDASALSKPSEGRDSSIITPNDCSTNQGLAVKGNQVTLMHRPSRNDGIPIK